MENLCQRGALTQLSLRDKTLTGQCLKLVGHVDTQVTLIQCYSRYQQYQQLIETAMQQELDQMIAIVADLSTAIDDAPESTRSGTEHSIDVIVMTDTSAIYAEIFAATDQALDLLNQARVLDYIDADQYARLRASLQSAPERIAKSIDEGLERIEQAERADGLSILNSVRIA